ncbi:FimB/Mfa2 family fimbrial subunit [uncultured Bacteroides sp.]|uniref:FimB/Mfa2 family fimbrial subunit n=1 Tax=uncultured Bacteroides sp. TaxID=162156 RepID=UPI0025E5FDA3|nr:FimB/Mfa2 family fimbrial subunit [uncultured Bacteroides sp.]
MRTNTLLKILSVFSAISLAGCDVKDPIYNTPHPGHGKITLTTDWTNRTAGIDIPASYTVVTGDYATVVSGASNTLDRLFEPGTYRAHIYNTPEHITVSGTVVTVAGASGNVDGVGQFVQEMPGWLFTSTVDAAIEKDTDYELTAIMQQQVRQLTFVIEPTGGTINQIESIEGYLSGAAGTLDIDTGTHGSASNVALEFARIATGADAGKWSATVRLLGTAGAQQRLHAQIRFADNRPTAVPLDSDLSAELSAFNTDKRTPLTLGGKVVETPTGVGFTATIEDWKLVNGGSVEAN